MSPQRVLLIIPCFNESGTIAKLLGEIEAQCPDYDTIVINDGSTDNTEAIARRLSPVLTHVVNLGIGGAVQSGIKYALHNGYDVCVQLDGDGQHPPERVKHLLAAFNETGSDIVIGSRFLDKEGFQSTFLRRMGIRAISQCLYLLFQKRFTDPTSGLRLMNRKAMALFSRDYPRDFPEPISIAVAMRRGLKLTEVAVNLRHREAGESSISGLKSISYMLRVTGYLFLNRVRSKA